MKKKQHRNFCILFTAACLLTGCGGDGKTYPSTYETSPHPKMEQLRLTSSPGDQVIQDDFGIVSLDYSNSSQGYICATLLKDPQKRVKIKIQKEQETTIQYYDLSTVNKMVSFPFSRGSGRYLVSILLNTSDDSYANICTQYIDVKLENEQIPFLYPNQIVDYNAGNKAIQKAFALCKDDDTVLKRIATLYNYVVDHIAYDSEKAKEVDDIYVLPIIDETLETKKGICFDYAALLTAMLRSQQIPTRLVTGNTSIEYHAWVEVYLPEKGWINPEVLLKSNKWSRMDPTFAASHSDYDDGYEDKYYY